MDRLSEDLKRTTQVASVIGRDFAYKILKSVMELGEELRGHLSNLVGIELLYEKTLYPELEYIFKHSLIQDVAYESLLKQRRREIHGRIARAIEELYADKLEQHYEILAHHWELSGNVSRAIEYLILAGEKSSKNMAAQAAFEFFGKALDLLEGSDTKLDPETEVKVRQGKGLAAVDIGDIDQAICEYRKAIDISRKEGMTDYEMANMAELAAAYWYSPIRDEEVIHFYDDALLRARKLRNKAVESRIMCSKGLYICSLGHRFEGNMVVAEAKKLALESKDQLSIIVGRLVLAGTERWLGKPRNTIELTDGMFEQMRGLYSVTYLASLVFLRGTALAECGRIMEAMELLAFGIDRCEKFGGVVHLGRHYNCLGYCYSEIYNSQKAWDLNVKSEAVARRLMEQYPMGRPMAAEIVAQANVNMMENLLDMGKSDEAWKRLKAFEEESKSEDYWRARDRWEARMNVLATEILLQRNETGQAMGVIEKEMERAKREHMKKFEGRFLRLLGEVQIKSNQRDAAIVNLKEALLIMKGVENPRQIWLAHASLAAAFATMNRVVEAREQWQSAASIIRATADGITDQGLRKIFLEAVPVQEILKRAKV